MSRLLSVAKTKQAVIERRKWVTRRAGWWENKNGRRLVVPGEHLTLVEKAMGRKPGEPLVRLAEVRVIDVRREPLNEITDYDVLLEGFNWAKGDLDDWGLERGPGSLRLPVGNTIAESFVRFYVASMGGTPDQLVTRIEWDYTDTPVQTIECSRPGQKYRLLEAGPILDVHLLYGRGTGSGPILCGFDRYAAKVGFNIGGGSTGRGIRHEPCQGCAALAVGRPVSGLHAAMFNDPDAERARADKQYDRAEDWRR